MIVVTGAAGFIGSAIVREAKQRGVAVGGTLSPQSVAPDSRSLVKVDLRVDHERLAGWMRDVNAAVLIHAAFPARQLLTTDPADSGRQAECIDATVIAAVRACPSVRSVLLLSSGAVYGDAARGAQRFTEAAPLSPTGAYGRIKLDQEKRWMSAGLDRGLVLMRAFNVTGPGEPRTLVCAAMAQRIAVLPSDGELPIRNSESVRDFVDVRDLAAAVLQLPRDDSGAFNVASGAGIRVSEMARRLLSVSGRNLRLQPDGRGGDSVSCGDASALRAVAAWAPRFDLQTSLGEVWREQSQS